MRFIFKPIWGLLFFTLPQAILSLLYLGAYNIIEPLLRSSEKKSWEVLSIIFFSQLIVMAIYLITGYIKKYEIKKVIFPIVMVFNIILLFIFIRNNSTFFPLRISRWILSSDEYMVYSITFIMPSLVYSMICLVAWLTPSIKEKKAILNIIPIILSPLIIYLLISYSYSVLSGVSYKVKGSIFMVTLILCSLSFFFFFFRLILIVSSQKKIKSKILHQVLKISFTIALPIAGLLLNNSYNYFSSGRGTFGDFTHPLFYFIAILSGIFICLPDFKSKRLRLILLLSRMVTSAYILYFILVFLPFLPLSIIAIIFFGSGFLMMAPLVNGFYYIKQIYMDIKYLKEYYNKKMLITLSLIFFMIIPLSITANYLHDRTILNNAMEHIYYSDYLSDKDISTGSVEKIINTMKELQRKKGFKNYKPYLSSFYKWIVFDNLTLSYKKINMVKSIYSGHDKLNYSMDNRPIVENKNVKVSKSRVKTYFNTDKKYYTSHLDFEIKNQTKGLQEFVTEIKIPDGAFISDYYLHVGDEKKSGLLVEKKSALWVYQNIVSRRRDPGILYYKDKNHVIFKVFPFTKHELRKTGFTLIHKKPITIEMGNRKFNLSDNKYYQNKNKNIESIEDNILYIPAEVKRDLKKSEDKPEYHFIIDTSLNAKGKKLKYIEEVERFTLENRINTSDIKISAGNYTFKDLDNKTWKDDIKAMENRGGFFLEYGLKRILLKSYLNKKTHPIIIVVTDSIGKSIFTRDLKNFEMTFPESDKFYLLDNSQLKTHSFTGDPLKSLSQNGNIRDRKKSLIWKSTEGEKYFIPDNNRDSYIIRDIKNLNIEDNNLNRWEKAMVLNLSWLKTELFPKENKTLWRELVKESFKQRIMLPVTSFIVVENQAQENALLKKQKEILKSKKYMDASEDVQRMSEPELIFFGGLLIIYLIIKNRRLKIFRRNI